MMLTIVILEFNSSQNFKLVDQLFLSTFRASCEFWYVLYRKQYFPMGTVPHWYDNLDNRGSRNVPNLAFLFYLINNRLIDKYLVAKCIIPNDLVYFNLDKLMTK